MRYPNACRTCRVRKRKCIVSGPRTPCDLCLSKRLPCSLAPKPLLVSAPVVASSASNDEPRLGSFSSVDSESMPDKALCDELVDLYFDLIHDKQHALFHRPSFIADQRQGRAPQYLVLAMMALVARFSSNPHFEDAHPWDRGRAWAERSKVLFDSRKETVSITSIQGCALLGNLAFIEGDPGLESIYGAVAIRVVQLLGLPKRLSLDRIQRETEIRIWWTTWMMDTWTSASVNIPKQLHAETNYERPMGEMAFMKLQDGNAAEFVNADDPSPCESGLWAQMIPLTSILAEIHRLNNRIVHHPESRLDAIDDVEELSYRLERWHFELPEKLRNRPENIERFAEQGDGRTFIALHLGYHYHSQLLYYQFLNHAIYGGQDRAQVYAARCKYHAKELSNLIWKANTTAGLECLWAINGHLIVVSSSVHLHTLLFDEDEARVSEAKIILARNFELLLQLQRYWPSLSLSMSRLKAFHQACQSSMQSTFDMDKWMLRFLQEYAEPVDKRTELFDEEVAIAWSQSLLPQKDWEVGGEPLVGIDILQSFFNEVLETQNA